MRNKGCDSQRSLGQITGTQNQKLTTENTCIKKKNNKWGFAKNGKVVTERGNIQNV